MICERTGIHFECYGSGHPVVILHPLATDLRSMNSWIEPIFSELPGFKRIYIDYPAHGYSRIKDGTKTTDKILEVLLEFLSQELGEKSFSMIGFSFGGYLAQGILAAKESQVRAICLMSPPLKLENRALPTKEVFKQDPGILSNLNPDIAAAFEVLMVNQTKENLERFMNEFQPGRELADRSFLQSDWRTKGYHFSFHPFPPEKTYPQTALILTAKNDHICGYKDHFGLLDHFPNGTYVVLGNCGHMMQIEQREKVTLLIGNWINEIIIE